MMVRAWPLVLLLATTVPPASGAEPLPARVEAVLKTPGYQSGHWGLLVVDAKTGATVFERNADELFCPASVTKLFSTAAALVDLGADYRFQTPVVRRGVVDPEGTLQGDLILIAQGDLSLGGRTSPEGALLFDNNDHTYATGNLNAGLVAADPLAGLDHLARAIHDSGVKAVSGDVLVDDRLFEPAESTGSGPSRLGPILVNDNVIDVMATPGSKPDEPAAVALTPVTAFATADLQVETGAETDHAWMEVRSVGPRRFAVRGRLPVGHKPVVKIYEVEEPAAFARTLFIECLRKRGVQVHAPAIGENVVPRLPTRAEVSRLPKVAEYTSPPFREYAKVILKVSLNLHASTLPLLIAAHHGDRTLSAGLRREGRVLSELGVDVGTIAFGGGAGGARADLVTPRATVALLRSMAQRPDFRAYETALPILGRDGTLAKAVDPESPARGHARAKTGTFWLENRLTGKTILTSKALAGYLETASGRPLVLAIFVNDVALDVSGPQITDATAAAGRVLGKLCEVFHADGPEPKEKEADAAAR